MSQHISQPRRYDVCTIENLTYLADAAADLKVAVIEYAALRERYLNLCVDIPDGPWRFKAGFEKPEAGLIPLDNVVYPRDCKIKSAGGEIMPLDITYSKIEYPIYYSQVSRFEMHDSNGVAPLQGTEIHIRMLTIETALIELGKIGRRILRTAPPIIDNSLGEDIGALARFYESLPRNNNFFPPYKDTIVGASREACKTAIEQDKTSAIEVRVTLRLYESKCKLLITTLSVSAPTSASKPKPGRPRLNNEQKVRYESLCLDWESARVNGASKKEFVAHKKIHLSELEGALQYQRRISATK